MPIALAKMGSNYAWAQRTTVTVEIPLDVVPLEFVATGRPASINDASKKKKWQTKVLREARSAVTGTYGAGLSLGTYKRDVTVKLFFFVPFGVAKYTDIDNPLKWTIDALAGRRRIILNDKKVQRIVAQRFVPPSAGKKPAIRAKGVAAATLLEAMFIQVILCDFSTAVKLGEFDHRGGEWW